MLSSFVCSADRHAATAVGRILADGRSLPLTLSPRVTVERLRSELASAKLSVNMISSEARFFGVEAERATSQLAEAEAEVERAESDVRLRIQMHEKTQAALDKKEEELNAALAELGALRAENAEKFADTLRGDGGGARHASEVAELQQLLVAAKVRCAELETEKAEAAMKARRLQSHLETLGGDSTQAPRDNCRDMSRVRCDTFTTSHCSSSDPHPGSHLGRCRSG